MNRRTAVAGALAVAVAAGVAATDAAVGTGRAVAPAAARTVALTGSQVVCPQGGTDPRTGRTTLAAAALPAPDAAAAGDVAVAAVPGGRAAPLLGSAGTLAARDVTRDKDRSEAVVATGGLAGGLEVEQLTRVTDGPYRGISLVRCVAPARDWWFAGGSGSLGHYDGLTLANTERAAALVDVTLYGHDGELDVPAAQGIVVPPQGRVALPLGRWVPDEQAVALHVVARTGRVAAALVDRRHTGSRPDGVDYLPAAAPPARQVVVPGVAAAGSDRRLVLAVPGPDDATVAVRVLGPKGAYVPTPLAQLSVKAGSVRVVDVSSVLGDSSVALQVMADQPVLAGALMRRRVGSTQYADTGWSAGVPPLAGPAALTQTRVHDGNTTTLLLTAAGDGAQVVRVRTLAPAAPRARTVEVAPGRTVAVDVATLLPASASGGGFAVEPMDGGPVWAAAVVYEDGAHGPLFSVLPLASPPRTTRATPVRLDPAAGLAAR